MLKHTISELKEALVCIQAGRVTLKYPFSSQPVEDTFRGRPVLDTSKCICCSACSNACPASLINLTDTDHYRLLHFELSRCTYCGNCSAVCPQHAIEMSDQFETSSPNKDDLNIQAAFLLIFCRDCGKPIGTKRQLALVCEKLADSLVWTNYASYLDLCLICRQKQAIQTPNMTIEVVP